MAEQSNVPLSEKHTCLLEGITGHRMSIRAWAFVKYLVDSASSHMLVSKIKPCMSKYKQLYGETANGSVLVGRPNQ